MTSVLEHGKIDNVLAERDADPRRIIARFKNPERKILQWKMRIRQNVDERFEWHYEKRFSARKSSRGSSKLQLPNEVTNFRRALIRSMVISQSRHAKTVS